MKLVPENINEAIKHLKPFTTEDLRTRIALRMRELYKELSERLPEYYNVKLEDDDNCVSIEKDGEVKFRIYSYDDYHRDLQYEMYCYSKGIYKTSYMSNNVDHIEKVIEHRELMDKADDAIEKSKNRK